MGTRSLCWYQGSGSSESSEKGEESTLGPFMVTKNVDLKTESYGFFLVGIFMTLSPRDSISNNPEITSPRRHGEESDYIEDCNHK